MSFVTANYGFWNLWTLYHKVTFDGANRIIYVNPDVTDLDIKVDLYSDWKEWVSSSRDNAVWAPAFRTIGGDPTVSGQYAGDIYFLINNWKLYIDLTKVRVTGVMFSDNYDSAYFSYEGLIQYPVLVSSLVNGSAQIANSTEIQSSLTTIDTTTQATNTTVNNIDTTVSSIDTTVSNIDSNVTSLVSSNAEILSKVLEVWQLMGLDLSNPKTITDTSITVNGITLSIGQPNADTTTVTRE